MDKYRINRIMESALSLHRILEDMKRIDLARKASDIYATAKEIKDGAAEVEPFANEEKALPDWVKVGAWGRNT